MQKVSFLDPKTAENTDFFVLEETQVNGRKYLLVTLEEDADGDAYLLREVTQEAEEAVYEMVDEDEELKAIGKVFAELLEDTDITY